MYYVRVGNNKDRRIRNFASEFDENNKTIYTLFGL